MDINKLLEKGSKTRSMRKDLKKDLLEFEDFVTEILSKFNLTDLDTLKKFDFKVAEDQKDILYVDDNHFYFNSKSHYFGFRYCGSRIAKILRLVFIWEKQYLDCPDWTRNVEYVIHYRDIRRGALFYYYNDYDAQYRVMTRNMTIYLANILTAFIENFEKQLDLMQTEGTLSPEVLSNIKMSLNLKINQ